MNPSVYLYRESENSVELYLGEYSTIKGLSLFDVNSIFELKSFGATCYQKSGWVTEDDLPKFENVKSIISFLRSEGEIGIVEFEACLPGLGEFGTHDDNECHFSLNSKHICMDILTRVVPSQHRDKLINHLVNNQGLYITCDELGTISKFGSFDEYLSRNA